jgi:hypothetical protein
VGHAAPDVGIGLEMEHKVAALHRLLQGGGIEDVCVYNFQPVLRKASQELRAASAEIVINHDPRPTCEHGVHHVASNKACSAGNENIFNLHDLESMMAGRVAVGQGKGGLQRTLTRHRRSTLASQKSTLIK